MRKAVYLPLMAAALASIAPLQAEDIDPANDGSQYGYAGNLGWINAEPLGDGGPGMQQAAGAVSGWLWSANSGWISLSCSNTASCATVDYGVVLDGVGNLSGFAWSPNLGWISFSCEDSASCGSASYGVSVSLGSGEISGYAYAPNAGWLSFSCESAASCGDVDYRVVIDLSEPPELIFEDGFES